MNKSSLRQPAPKSIKINREMVILFIFIVAILFLWVLFLAFRRPVVPQPAIIKIQQEDIKNPVLSALPDTYQDREKITLYQQSDAQQVLRKEIEDMKKILNAQRNEMNMQNGVNNQDVQMARKSDLFFASTKPANEVRPGNKVTAGQCANLEGAYNEQNMQGQKNNFLQNKSQEGDIYNKYSLVKPVSPYEIQAGAIISATLLTTINTSLPGDVVAQVRQDIFDTVKGKYLLIPKGSRLLGRYDSSVSYGQERILIVFTRIIRPDGSSIQLSNFTGSDDLGSSGFAADVNNHWGRVLGAATISTMLSFGAGVVADRNTGTNPYYPSAQQGALVGGAAGIVQAGQTITNRAINIQPALSVPAGFNFNVIVNKDMILEPYV